MNQVVIFGNSQMASMMYFYLTHDSNYTVAAFTVNQENLKDTLLEGIPVVPFEEIEHSHPPDRFRISVPISYRNVNKLRAVKYREARAKGYETISYISSKAITWPDLTVGDNCIVLEGSVIQPFTKIGNNVFIGCGSMVGHHCSIAEHCFLAPGSVALGNTRIEPYCFIGANATIRDGVTVARECVVGAGVTIRRDTKAQEVYMGERAEPAEGGSTRLGQWLTWSS